MVEFSIHEFALDNRILLITGGASGLGKYYTQAVSSVGADVFIVLKGEDGWEETNAFVKAQGQHAVFMRMDITTEGTARAIVQKALDCFGRIDILINNAGMQRRHELMDFTDEEWNAVIDLNLNALNYLCHEVAKVMIDQHEGKIVNIGSMQSFRTGKFIYPYTASKHAVVGLTKAYADALAPHNIQVNALSPGYINTLMTEALQHDPLRSAEIREHIPAGHWEEPRELMGTMVFLCSKAFDCINGITSPSMVAIC